MNTYKIINDVMYRANSHNDGQTSTLADWYGEAWHQLPVVTQTEVAAVFADAVTKFEIRGLRLIHLEDGSPRFQKCGYVHHRWDQADSFEIVTGEVEVNHA